MKHPALGKGVRDMVARHSSRPCAVGGCPVAPGWVGAGVGATVCAETALDDKSAAKTISKVTFRDGIARRVIRCGDIFDQSESKSVRHLLLHITIHLKMSANHPKAVVAAQAIPHGFEAGRWFSR